MKRTYSTMTSSSGFTLVEIIATIILMGILAAFFIHFMGTAISQSSKSIELVTGEADAEGIMEVIIAYYTSKINENPDRALDDVYNRNFGSSVTKQYIIFNDATGNENAVISPDTSNNLKVSVGSPVHNLTTILTKSRVNTSDPAVNY